jgi:hypothetical protein
VSVWIQKVLWKETRYHLFTYICTIYSCCQKPLISMHLKKRKVRYVPKHILRIKYMVRRRECVKSSELKRLVRLYVSHIYSFILTNILSFFFSIILYSFFSLGKYSSDPQSICTNTFLLACFFFSLSYSFSPITLEYNRGYGWIMHFIEYWSFLFNNISKNVHHKWIE